MTTQNDKLKEAAILQHDFEEYDYIRAAGDLSRLTAFKYGWYAGKKYEREEQEKRVCKSCIKFQMAIDSSLRGFCSILSWRPSSFGCNLWREK